MKLSAQILIALAATGEGSAPGLNTSLECRDSHQFCSRWSGSCYMKQVSATCRKTCGKCTAPLVASYMPQALSNPYNNNYRTNTPSNQFRLPTFGRPVQTGLPISGNTVARNPVAAHAPPAHLNGWGFQNVMSQIYGKPAAPMKPVAAVPVVPVAPVAPVQQQEEPKIVNYVPQPVYVPVQAPVQPVVQNRPSVYSNVHDQIPFEVAVMSGYRDPYGNVRTVYNNEAYAIKPVAPSVYEQYAPQPAAPVETYVPVAPEFKVEPYVPVAPVAPIQTTAATTQATTTTTTTTTVEEIEGSAEAPEEVVAPVGVVTTQAPTEAPEGSSPVEEEIDEVDAIPVTFEEVAALPITREETTFEADEIPDAVIVGSMDPATAADLMDAMCVDELTNCDDFGMYDFCNITKDNAEYAMYLPFQQGCRKTCGHCDKNASCPDLVDFCAEEDVRAICGATCRDL